jgi:hypothetical protein
MEQNETMILSDKASTVNRLSLEESVCALLEGKRRFEQFLRSQVVVDDYSFAIAAFNLMQGCCKITGADGASLYSSKREGYLDRQAFCSDPNLASDQIRSASQASEHVAVGDGIAGYIALDREGRKQFNYNLRYPIKETGAIEVWDIRIVAELPEKLRYKTTQLSLAGAIDISSMLLIKETGVNGTDLILQLIRERANGLFSDQEKLVAEVFAEMLFPSFRDLEDYRDRAKGVPVAREIAVKSTGEIIAEPIGDITTPIQQIAADAYAAIKAIATTAMDKLQKTGSGQN